MDYLSIPHYRGLKEKYDKQKHANGIFFTTDTHEIIANDTAYNELIKDWATSDGTLTLRMTSGKTYEFTFNNASETEKGLLSIEDKKTIDRLSNSYKDLGNFHSKEEALNALAELSICADTSIAHVHCTYSDKNVSIDMCQSIQNDYCRQVIFHETNMFQRAIYFANSGRTAISYKEDFQFLFGDRLKWDESANKYVLSLYENTFNASVTDSIPTATSSKDGLISKDDKQKLDAHLSNRSNPHSVTKTQVGLGNVTNDAQVKRSEMGVVKGVATLDESGKIPSSQLPSYVDDVLEFQDKASFPKPGESGKIYVELKTNLTYRWSGTDYVEISASLALGETQSTAYPGNKGKDTTDKLNKIRSTILSHIDDETPFSSTTTGVTLNYHCYQNDLYGDEGNPHNPSIPVASTTQAGIVTAANMITLQTCSGMLGSITENIGEINTKIPELSKAIDDTSKTVNTLDKYGYIGVIPSWTPLNNLTTNSTSEEIVKAIALRDVDGKTLTTAADINDIFNKCAVYGKYIIDNLTRCKIQVEYNDQFFIVSELYSASYQNSNKAYVYGPQLRTISFIYSKDSGLAVRDKAVTYPLYKSFSSIGSWLSRGDDLGLQLELKQLDGTIQKSSTLPIANYTNNNVPGLMRAADKKKLDTIEEGAQKNIPILAE